MGGACQWWAPARCAGWKVQPNVTIFRIDHDDSAPRHFRHFTDFQTQSNRYAANHMNVDEPASNGYVYDGSSDRPKAIDKQGTSVVGAQREMPSPLDEMNRFVSAQRLLEILWDPESRPSLRWLRSQQKRMPHTRVGRRLWYCPALVKAHLERKRSPRQSRSFGEIFPQNRLLGVERI